MPSKKQPTSLSVSDLGSLYRTMKFRGYTGRYVKDHVSFKDGGDLHADDLVTGVIIEFMKDRGFHHFMSLNPDNTIHSIHFKRSPV